MPPELTSDERAVAAGLAAGRTIGEIAAQMSVTIDIVYRLSRTARRKLGARTMPHLAAIAARLGL